MPALGVAKSLLVGEAKPLGESRGSTAELRHREELVGMALRTRDATRPVYVSVGHRLDLTGAVRLALDCTAGFRLPEPTRLADQLVAAAKRAAPLIGPAARAAHRS